MLPYLVRKSKVLLLLGSSALCYLFLYMSYKIRIVDTIGITVKYTRIRLCSGNSPCLAAGTGLFCQFESQNIVKITDHGSLSRPVQIAFKHIINKREPHGRIYIISHNLGKLVMPLLLGCLVNITGTVKCCYLILKLFISLGSLIQRIVSKYKRLTIMALQREQTVYKRIIPLFLKE